MAERDRLLSGYWGNTQSGVRIPPSPPKNSFARESGQKSFFFIRSVRDLLTLYHTESKPLKTAIIHIRTIGIPDLKTVCLNRAQPENRRPRFSSSDQKLS